MDNSSWQPEPDPLERMLARDPRPLPSPELRGRVLEGVRAELRKNMLQVIRMELRRQRIQSKWRFAAAFAATILVCLSVSLGVMHAARRTLAQNEAPPSLDDVAWRLQQISPQLTKEESLLQAKWRQISVEGNEQATLGDLLGLGRLEASAKTQPNQNTNNK